VTAQSSSDPLRVLAVDCSPAGTGSTSRVLAAVLAGAQSAGAATTLMRLASDDGDPIPEVLAALSDAEAFVFGSPMYRATYAAPFKVLLDQTPRGMWGETQAPLTARAVALVATGASDHHFLGLASMRDVLVDFFAAHVVSPGLYVPRSGFGDDRELLEPHADRARLQGVALLELAQAIRTSSALGRVTPQV
jgi:FMN reductase